MRLQDDRSQQPRHRRDTANSPTPGQSFPPHAPRCNRHDLVEAIPLRELNWTVDLVQLSSDT